MDPRTSGRARTAKRKLARRGAPRLVTSVVAALLVVVVVGLGGCGGDAATTPVYSEADNGTTVRAAVGDAFTIRLGENPSTGYTWTLRQSSGLKLLRDEFEQPTASPVSGGPSPALVGAPGTRVFEFEVAGTATQLIQAVYHRTWETRDDAGTQEFTLTVAVE